MIISPLLFWQKVKPVQLPEIFSMIMGEEMSVKPLPPLIRACRNFVKIEELGLISSNIMLQLVFETNRGSCPDARHIQNEKEGSQ